MQYLATMPKEITLSTKFFHLEFDGGKIEIDVQGLMKADKDSEDAWINVTPILKAYNVRFRNWIQNKSVKEYINIRNNDFLIGLDSSGLKIPFKSTQWYLKEDFIWLENDCPLICTRRGRYHAGTWLHRDLFLKFITVLDVRIEVSLHKAIEEIIRQSIVVKIERNGTKALFHELTDTIRDIYIPAQKSKTAVKYAYSSLMTLANIKVLGCSAKKYCSDNNIEITEGMISIRDALPEYLLDKIKLAEKHLNGLILYGGIVDYEILRDRLMKM